MQSARRLQVPRSALQRRSRLKDAIAPFDRMGLQPVPPLLLALPIFRVSVNMRIVVTFPYHHAYIGITSSSALSKARCRSQRDSDTAFGSAPGWPPRRMLYFRRTPVRVLALQVPCQLSERPPCFADQVFHRHGKTLLLERNRVRVIWPSASRSSGIARSPLWHLGHLQCPGVLEGMILAKEAVLTGTQQPLPIT